VKSKTAARRFLAIAALALVAGAAWWWNPARRLHREVEYWAHGRSWTKPGENWRIRERRERAALQTLGPGVVDILIEDLRRKDAWFDRPITAGPLTRVVQRIQRSHKPTPEVRTEAAAALGLLGPAGAGAEAPLLDLLEKPVTGMRPAIDNLEVLIVLQEIGCKSQRAMRVYRKLMANGRPREQMAAAIAILIIEPGNATARGVVASLLDPANPGIIANAFTAAKMASRVGSAAQPVAMPLRLGIIKSYLLWSREALARLAYGVWRADGKADVALQILVETTTELAESKPPTDLLDQRLCSLAEDLGEIPEFALKARPWIERIDAAGSLSESRRRALDALAPSPPTPTPTEVRPSPKQAPRPAP
jgi:hypothetical protein